MENKTKNVKTLLPTAMAMATNYVIEYALGKVAIELLDAALPGAFGKFSKFAIKFGISTIYGNTIGEKIAASMMEAYKVGETFANTFYQGFFDENDSEET